VSRTAFIHEFWFEVPAYEVFVPALAAWPAALRQRLRRARWRLSQPSTNLWSARGLQAKLADRVWVCTNLSYLDLELFAPGEVPASRSIVSGINRLSTGLRALQVPVIWVLHANTHHDGRSD
jgi:hypothetical protein